MLFGFAESGTRVDVFDEAARGMTLPRGVRGAAGAFGVVAAL